MKLEVIGLDDIFEIAAQKGNEGRRIGNIPVEKPGFLGAANALELKANFAIPAQGDVSIEHLRSMLPLAPNWVSVYAQLYVRCLLSARGTDASEIL
jgi:hypothetical protein